MKVLIGCEESQAVCIAFRERGFEAYSCDLQDCSGGHPEWHLKMDVFEAIEKVKPKLGIFHPPCTFLSYCGNGYFNLPGRAAKRIQSLDFFCRIWTADIEHICIENPLGIADHVITKHHQRIEPYYFGDRHLKRTCLWLKNLPVLKYNMSENLFKEPVTATEYPEPIYIDKSGKRRFFTDATGGYHGEGNSTLKRSKTFPGIANAMATQWGAYLKEKQAA